VAPAGCPSPMGLAAAASDLQRAAVAKAGALMVKDHWRHPVVGSQWW